MQTFSALQALGARLETTPNGELSAVDLSDVPGADAGLELLAGQSALKSLTLPPVVTDRGLEYLAGLENLEELDLKPCRAITDRGLKSLSTLSGLKRLTLPSSIGNVGLLEIRGLRRRGLRKLEKLDLSYCRSVRDPGVAHLEGLASLRVLILSFTDIADAALVEIASLGRLEALSLRGTRVATLEPLRGCRSRRST